MSGFISTNTLLQISDHGSVETWTTIAELGDLAGPNFSASKHDTSTHSLGSPWSTLIVGLRKHEDFNFPINFGPVQATHSYANNTPAIGLGYLFRTGGLKRYRLVPVGFEENSIIFEAYVTQMGHAYPVDGVMTAQVTLSPTGEPEFEVDAS